MRPDLELKAGMQICLHAEALKALRQRKQTGSAAQGLRSSTRWSVRAATMMR